MTFDPRTLALYPDQPGVYLMKDHSGQVLYIGKAKNLRVRLKQYYAESGDSREMVPYLTAQVEAIDTIVALTEKDALILENNLIKRHKPKYNVLLKDDKTFVSLVVTQHQWPMIRLVRYKGTRKTMGPILVPTQMLWLPDKHSISSAVYFLCANVPMESLRVGSVLVSSMTSNDASLLA